LLFGAASKRRIVVKRRHAVPSATTTQSSRSPTPPATHQEAIAPTQLSPLVSQSKRVCIVSDNLAELDSIVGEADRTMELSNTSLERDNVDG